MDKYLEATKNIPWASMGRETVASKIGHSLLPVGVMPFELEQFDPSKPVQFTDSNDPNFENYLMHIVGTAIQVGEGKLVTCRHVVQAVLEKTAKGYILARTFRGNTVIYGSVPFDRALNYIDPRSKKVNLEIDLALIPLAVVNTPEHPYEIPIIKWGDSTMIGVGDSVVVGGYPYGTDLFLATQSNRGIIQPTFYPGIVSAVIPALNEQETRIIQVSASVAGGISGGALFDPNTGKVLGMVSSGIVDRNQALQPVTYALPSEVIAPFAGSISFEAGGRRWGKEDPVGFGSDMK